MSAECAGCGDPVEAGVTWCPNCPQRTAEADANPCPDCDGTGRVTVFEDGGRTETWTDCSYCYATGVNPYEEVNDE